MPDLKQELQTLADRRSAESTANFDGVVATVSSRRRRRTAGWSAAAAVVAVAAVTTLTPWDQSDTAPTTTESPRIDSRWPNPVTITPDTARAGATVALTFPDAMGRGIAFQLAKATEPSKILYYMTSDWGQPAKHKPTWWAYGESRGWVDVGINGPGPDHVVVPDTAEDGTYLLCTANAARQVCGLLTVRR
ncbi:hypothetical protein AB0F43_27320 [Kribbella sp. NPDC023972]|uniref:hypothetical protein n=1 Tax=Kribbella sp. NPDC023972 TaxID=3154795 RepID=UPI00340310BD